MTGAGFISGLARENQPDITESIIKQAVKNAADILSRNLQFEGAKLESDDRWHVGIRDADTGDLYSVVFVKPPNANQEWYMQEIIKQIGS